MAITIADDGLVIVISSHTINIIRIKSENNDMRCVCFYVLISYFPRNIGV